MVFVTGAGIGKTTVVDALLGRHDRGATLWVAWGQRHHYGAGEAFLPVLDALGRLAGAWHASHRGTASMRRRGWSRCPCCSAWPTVKPCSARGRAPRESACCASWRSPEVVTAEQPLVLVLEDPHWTDHATVDLLAWLARRREPPRLLLLGTYRPVEVIVQGHPLRAVTRSWSCMGSASNCAWKV